MRKMALFVLTMGLFLMASPGAADADTLTLSPNETLQFSGTGSQNSPCCTTATVTGTFTIGSFNMTTMDWTVTAFDAIPDKCGSSDCSTLVWSFAGLVFDASNDTFSGTVSTDFTGSGGDSRELIVTFMDGNTAADPFKNLDLTRERMGDFTNDKSGTISYSVLAPEPSSWLLLASGLLALMASTRRRKQLA